MYYGIVHIYPDINQRSYENIIPLEPDSDWCTSEEWPQRCRFAWNYFDSFFSVKILQHSSAASTPTYIFQQLRFSRDNRLYLNCQLEWNTDFVRCKCSHAKQTKDTGGSFQNCMRPPGTNENRTFHSWTSVSQHLFNHHFWLSEHLAPT